MVDQINKRGNLSSCHGKHQIPNIYVINQHTDCTVYLIRSADFSNQYQDTKKILSINFNFSNIK